MLKKATQSRCSQFFSFRYQVVKIVLNEKVENDLEKGKKGVPLQPANEETRIAGKFIKELEKAKREREKDFKKSFAKPTKYSHLCSPQTKKRKVKKSGSKL
jgi:hypothetical protein